jgi:glycosyltransferase involved in cell wall biosynthesis
MSNYQKLKISIITVSYNSKATIADTIASVASQTYSNIEHIIIDGASSDGTIEIIISFGSKVSKFITEPDKGIYNAMNKGIGIANGDIIGILNSDDYLSDNFVIETIVKGFQKYNIDAIYGDVKFIDPRNTKRVVRYYSSKSFHPKKFKYGIMPAHPSFYVKKSLYETIGLYKEDYKIAADYELLIRFFKKGLIKIKYIPIPFVSMRTGGISNKSLKSCYILNKEILRACRDNGINTNIFNIYSKYFIKIFEFFRNQKYYG